MITYIGVTIGPIYKTLKNAKKTRELWAGSYIFSYIMRRIIENFRDYTILLPQFDPEMLDNPESRRGIGMFPDRCIFIAKNKESDLKVLRNSADKILNDIGKCLGNVDYIKKYFQVSWCQISFNEKCGYIDAVSQINKTLDAIELQKNFIDLEYIDGNDDNFITAKLRDTGDSSSRRPPAMKFLFEDSGRKDCKFDSIPRIAARDLKYFIDEYASKNNGFPAYDEFWNEHEEYERKYEEEKEQSSQNARIDPYEKLGDLFKEMKENGRLRKYHKYITIVKADGDNLSVVIKNLRNNGDFTAFSGSLFEYAKKAHNAIQEYGGATIYAGGDDLLFFAPVKIGNRTIFDLIDKLSELYKKIVQGDTALSFGVSISYYKYPLYEALEAANELLFQKAKYFPGKNAVAVRLLKHSGREAEAIFSKVSPFDTMRNFVTKSLDNNPLFNSLTNTLKDQTAILKEIGNSRDRIVNYLNNSFNEEIHRNNPEFMEALVNMIFLVYTDGRIKKQRETLDALFKIASFMQEKFNV